jgi:hypothetical protein
MSIGVRELGIVGWAKGLSALVVVWALSGEINLDHFRSAYAHWPDGPTPTLSSRFSSWDVAHYLQLSRDGYEAGSHSCAFYPLWPALINLGATVTRSPPLLAALLLTQALSLLGFWMLYRLIKRHTGADVARDSLILMLAFPGALFFSFPYSESIFLAIVMLFFWGLELKRWPWIATASFLLPMTRPTGLFIIVPLGWWLWENRRPEAEHVKRPSGTRVRCKHFAFWLLLICPLLGSAAYFGLMYAWTGNALEGFAAQTAYPNSPSIANIFRYVDFWHALKNLRTLDGMLDAALDRLFFVAFLALLWPIYRLDRVWFFYVLPAGLIPALSSWFMSYRRYIMVLFPLFVVLALSLRQTKRRWIFWYYVVLMAALQGWAIRQFTDFDWAG